MYPSCKESHLGYFFKLFGSLPTTELEEIDIATNIIKKAIENAPIDQYLKKNEEEKYILRLQHRPQKLDELRRYRERIGAH